MILVRNIRLPLSAGEPQAFEKALHTLRVPRSKVEHTGVAKLSVDARHGQPKLVYTVAVTFRQPGEEAALAARCSRLADRRHDARLVEAAAERENLLALGLAQVRLREGIEGNQVELARHVFTAHEFDEFVGLLKAPAHVQ